MNNLLVGESILVVGAGGLLGAKVTKYALEQGAKVVAVDLSLKNLKAKLLKEDIDISNSNLVCSSLDITVESEVINFFENGIKITGAVNCTYPRNKAYGTHFYDVTMSNFNENLSLHLGSAFLLTQQCAKYFKLNQMPFSLVNISSIYGLITPKFDIYQGTSMTMPIEYSAIKASIQHISKYTVSFVNDSRFRINCVCPGGIFDNQQDSFLNAYQKKTHGKGMLNVKDVTSSVLFLLSTQSKYITGQNIVVDDGFTL